MKDQSVQVSDMFFLLVYVSPDHPAMKAVASGHDGNLQGCPKNLKYKI